MYLSKKYLVSEALPAAESVSTLGDCLWHLFQQRVRGGSCAWSNSFHWLLLMSGLGAATVNPLALSQSCSPIISFVVPTDARWSIRQSPVRHLSTCGIGGTIKGLGLQPSQIRSLYPPFEVHWPISYNSLSSPIGINSISPFAAGEWIAQLSLSVLDVVTEVYKWRISHSCHSNCIRWLHPVVVIFSTMHPIVIVSLWLWSDLILMCLPMSK